MKYTQVRRKNYFSRNAYTRSKASSHINRVTYASVRRYTAPRNTDIPYVPRTRLKFPGNPPLRAPMIFSPRVRFGSIGFDRLLHHRPCESRYGLHFRTRTERGRSHDTIAGDDDPNTTRRRDNSVYRRSTYYNMLALCRTHSYRRAHQTT